MEISCNKLFENILKFPKKYHNDFDSFWAWKNTREAKGESIFSNDLIENTYVRLSRILISWQTYRNSKNNDPLSALRESFNKIKEPYENIRQFDLTQFKDVPREDLLILWHELGRVKEYEGSRNSRGVYNIIAVCKPLMLLWGQTLAYDYNVRYNISGMNIRSDQFIWRFDKWYDAMLTFSEYLNTDGEVKDCIQKFSRNKYGDGQVPYGRFLDIYYFIG